MRDDTLPAMTEQLDQLAASMRDELNRVHNRGANSPFGNGQAAADAAAMYGTRIFSGSGDAITLGSDVTLQILDANGDPATTPLTISAGATTVGAVTTAIDGYLDSGIDFGEAALNSNRLEIKLESGYRLAILDNGPAADNGDSTITFGADTYLGFSNFFGLNNIFDTPELTTGLPAMENQGTQTGISSTFELRSDLLTNPEHLSRGLLRGTSPNFSLGAGDNEIAQQLAEAFSGEPELCRDHEWTAFNHNDLCRLCRDDSQFQCGQRGRRRSDLYLRNVFLRDPGAENALGDRGQSG